MSKTEFNTLLSSSAKSVSLLLDAAGLQEQCDLRMKWPLHTVSDDMLKVSSPARYCLLS